MVTGELTREDLLALNLYLVKGYNFRQVYDLAGVTRTRLKGLLDRPDVRGLMKDLMEEFQQELNSLQDVVLDKLRDLLDSPDPRVRLEAIEKWARLNGRYKDSLAIGKMTSAEDVARQLIAGDGEDTAEAVGEREDDEI